MGVSNSESPSDTVLDGSEVDSQFILAHRKPNAHPSTERKRNFTVAPARAGPRAVYVQR
jgi:hypothetical protein